MRSGGLDTAVVIVESPPADRVRSPVDVLRLVTAAAAIVLVLLADRLFGETLVAFASELFAGLSAVPAWIVDLTVLAARLLALALLLAAAATVLRHRRPGPAVAVVSCAAVVAAGLTALFSSSTHASGPPLLQPWSFPWSPSAAGLAAMAGAVTAAAPWLGRRWRRMGWVAVLGLALSRFLSTPASFDTAAAVLWGWLVGAAAVVVFGGPGRRPRGQAVVAGLAEVGVVLARLEQARVDARGSTPYFGRTVGGRQLFVKVLGDDERSADRLFRLYRRFAPHDFGDERPFSSLRRAVEHEALLAMTARSCGVRTPRLVAVARAAPNGFALAYEAVDGRSLDRISADALADGGLDAAWGQVAVLHAHHIAHRDLRLANLLLDEHGWVWVIDFGFAELVAPSVLLDTDVAELLASSAVLVGPDRAVLGAAAAVGATSLRSTLPRLRPWALSGATRTALRSNGRLLDDLRRRVGAL